MTNARTVLSRRLHHREIHLRAFFWSGIDHTLYTTRWALSEGIEAYSRVFTVDRVADDQREFTISRAVGMRFVPIFLPYNFSFAFSYNIVGTLRKQEALLAARIGFTRYYRCKIKLIGPFKP